MGGHGGLNILPQKRWNVYNRDNRLKVARDEAAHAVQEQGLQAKHRAAEAEARRKLLLQRAKERRAEALQNAGLLEALDPAADQTGPTDDEPIEQTDAGAAQEIARQPEQFALAQQNIGQQQQMQSQQEKEKQPVMELMNLWEAFEAKTEHPDRLEEKKEEKRKRGNPDTYTSDARFDESFRLGHGLSGPKPWYARAVDPCAEQQWQQVVDQQQQRQHQRQQHMLALPGSFGSKTKGSKRRRSSSPSNSSSSSDSDSSAEPRHEPSKSKSSSSKHSRKHKNSHSKDKHKKSSKQHKHSSSSRTTAEADKALTVARLRAERLEREAAERHRSLVATGQMPAPTKRYNSSYGYADALKAGNMGAAGLAAARRASATAVTGLGQRFR